MQPNFPLKSIFLFLSLLLVWIPQPAQAQDGTPQDAAPQLTASHPADGTADVDPMSDIFVRFNQPVVELAGVDQAGVDAPASQPQPLSFDPPVAGVGEWINTSIYRFVPENGLAGATDYVVTLSEIDGGFSFRTAEPEAYIAQPNVIQIGPNQIFQFDFNQAMDRASTEAAFSLGREIRPNEELYTAPQDGLVPPPPPSYLDDTPSNPEPPAPSADSLPNSLFEPPLEPPPLETEPVSGAFSWNAESTSLTFTPDQPLTHGGSYFVTIAESARSANLSAGLRNSVSAGFGVIPLPQVLEISPYAQGFYEEGNIGYRDNVDPADNVVIQFRTPMSVTTLLPNISVTPVLTETQVFSRYIDYHDELTISWNKQPNTVYTVTIGADATDLYGNPLGKTMTAVYTTGDYGPLLQLDMGQFTHLNAYTQTQVSARYRNIESIEIALYRIPEDDLFRLTGSREYEAWDAYRLPADDEQLVWARTFKPTGEPNVINNLAIPMFDDSGDLLAPGIYALKAKVPPEIVAQSSDPDAFVDDSDARILLIGNRNLLLKKSPAGDSLVWLTDLLTGQPIAGQEVQIYLDGGLSDKVVTDADGIARVPLGLNSNNYWHPLLAMVGRPGEADFAAVSTRWNNGISPWEFSLPGGVDGQIYRSHFYTDRPIYRPGQTINWKGIVRRVEVGTAPSTPGAAGSLGGTQTYSVPPNDLPIAVTLRIDRGNIVWEGTVQPNEFGTVNGSVDLPDAAMSGFYFIDARIGDSGDGERDPSEFGYGGVGFQVGSYQKPEFEVEIVASEASVTVGQPISVTAAASYFSGGPLADAAITWRVIAEPFTFFWPDSPAGRFFNFAPVDLSTERFDPYSIDDFGIVREGVGVTDGDGTFALNLPTELADLVRSQIWTIGVTVQSGTNQFVSGSTRVDVHVDDAYVGVSPQQYVTQVGDESVIDLVALTPAGDPAPDTPIVVEAYAITWSSVYERDTSDDAGDDAGGNRDGALRWQSRAKRDLLLSDLVVTDADGFAAFAWSPPRGGQVQIVARSQTKIVAPPNQPSSGAFVYAVGAEEEFAPWRHDDNDRIDLVVARDSYAPGEVAEILVPSPFVGPVEALITIEQGGIISAERATFSGNSETISVPIRAAFLPNIFVSVAIAKGVDETNPTPAMRVGYAQINVDTSQKELRLEVAPSAETLRPGETVTYTLTVRDDAGTLVPNAEVSVALIDKALLSLANAIKISPLELFYRTLPLGVEMGSLLTISADRFSPQLAEDGRGGGGGDGPGLLDLRVDFPDSAHWRADYVSDENGEIVLAVPLPDNLTTWTLVALAVDAETRFGEAEAEIVATKAVQIRPLLPRFFTAGDRARVGAVVVNASDETQAGTLSFTGFGFDKLDEPAVAEPDRSDGVYELEAGEQIRIEWPIEIDADATGTTFDFVTQATTDGDAVRISLPVRRYRVPDVVGTSGRVSTAGVTESIRVPDDAVGAELRLTLEPTLAAGMLDGLDYLEQYEYECSEQTVSRFLPNLFSYRALTTLGEEDVDLRAKLDEQLTVAVQKLTARQNGDGGWGYWPNEQSTSFITAYVYWGLRHAANQGFGVPQRVLETAHDYLLRDLVAPSDIRETWRLNEMAFVHFVLAETGMGDAGGMSELYDERARMQLYGRALLAMALAAMPSDNPRVQTLLDDLATNATVTATGAYWTEPQVDYRTLNTDTRTTAIVLAAFSRWRPDDPLTAQAVRWLMDARKAGRWPSTQENAWSLIALTDWLAASDELNGDYEWAAVLNGEELGRGAVDAGLVADRARVEVLVSDLLRDRANQLLLTKDDPSGQLTYTAHLKTYADGLAARAQSRGIVVDRRFEVNGSTTNQATVGDVISVTVTLVAPTDLHHVLVEANLPAGIEPIDPNLATASEHFDDPTVKADGGSARAISPWNFWQPTHVDIRDDKVVFFATFLPAGTVEYTFQGRATLAGEFRVLPTHAEQMYFTETWGRSAGGLFTVVE